MSDVFFVVGCSFIVAGLWLIFMPAGVIAAGISLIVISLGVERSKLFKQKPEAKELES